VIDPVGEFYEQAAAFLKPGGDPRQEPWPGYRVGEVNRGVAIATGMFGGS
jgi:hypothetical protein